MIIKENTIDNGCVNVTIKTVRTLLYSLTLDTDYSNKLKAVRDGVTKQINTEV